MSVSDQIVISCDYASCDQTIVLNDDGDSRPRDVRVAEALTQHAWGKTRVTAAGTTQRAVQHCQIHSREMRMLLGDDAAAATDVLETSV